MHKNFDIKIDSYYSSLLVDLIFYTYLEQSIFMYVEQRIQASFLNDYLDMVLAPCDDVFKTRVALSVLICQEN